MGIFKRLDLITNSSLNETEKKTNIKILAKIVNSLTTKTYANKKM